MMSQRQNLLAMSSVALASIIGLGSYIFFAAEHDVLLQAPVALLTQAEEPSSWRLFIDDERDGNVVAATLSNPSIDEFQSGAGELKSAFLVMTCDRGTTSVHVFWDVRVGQEKVHGLEHFDNNNSRSQIWALSEDNDSTLVQNSARFVEDALQHQNYTIQLIVESSTTVALGPKATFDLSGLELALQPLKEYCMLLQ